MLIQALKNPQPFALLTPEVPGAIELPSGAMGINFAAARGNFPDKGLKVQIPIWANKNLLDTVELLLNGNRVDQKTITDPVELVERTTLFVPTDRLLTGEWNLSYRVTRHQQQPELFTPPLKLDVKLEIPGGQDIDPDYGHSELFMTLLPPEIVQDGVDKDSAKNGVDVIVQAKPGSGNDLPYPDIDVGDVITVSWGGKLVLSAPVNPAQIGAPAANPIKVHIDEVTILAAGDSGPEGLAVTFMVRDRVLNQSEDWCKETRIVVDTGNSRLDAPILQQADGNVLDLDTLDDEPLHLQVWAASAEFQQNDVIIMSLKGTTLDGEAIDVKVRQPIEKKPPLVVDVLLSNAVARELAKTQGMFSYELERSGEIVNRSRGRFINIVGEPKRLAAPIALDATSGALDPDLASTRIRIPYDPLITAETAIELKWFGTRPENTTYDPELDWFFPSESEASDPNGFVVSVDGKHLKTIEGGTLDLSYNLLSDDNGNIVRRASLHATLLNVGEPQFELVKPIVLGEKDGALEPKDLPNGMSKLTAPRPIANPTKSGDRVTYTWVGEVSGEKEDSKPLNALSANKDVDFPLDAAFVRAHIEPNRGKKITVSYRIFRAQSNTTSYSNPLAFTIGEPQSSELPAAKIREAKGDQLNPDDVMAGATVVIAAEAQFKEGDEVTVSVKGQSTIPLPAYTVKLAEADNELSSIKVPHSVISAEEGKSIALTYTVKRKAGGTDGPSDPTVYEVSKVVAPIILPVAKIKEAKGDQLNPDDVTAGATVVIAAEAQFKEGDEVTVTVEGQSTTSLPPYTVKPAEADKELSSIKVPHNVISDEEGKSIALTYTVKRKAGGTDGPSDPTVYDVRKVIAPGKLRVMGARYNRSIYRAASTSRLLMAFDANTGKPLQAEWKYASESNWTKAATWLDTAPQEHLQVRTADDQLTLSEANIFGSGSDTTITGQAAFVALRDKNDMTGWGHGPNGGVIPPTIITMNDIVEVSCTRSTYAARRTNNTTIAWSTTAGEGSDMGAVNPFGFVQVVGNIAAFAGIRGDGTVDAWSTAAYGGVTSAEIKAVTNAVDVIPAGQAFAVRLATGHVKAWGLPANVGTVPAPVSTLDDIEAVIGNPYAFAAYRTNHTLVAWGNPPYGGVVPAPIAAMTDIKRLACANNYSFAALRNTNQVVAWGPAAQGGTVPTLISALTDIISVVATWVSFAALRENGHVVAWPETNPDGKVPDTIAARDDVVQVAGTSYAFAVLYKDGTVGAWGNATVGGDTKPVADQLTDVRAIYANTHGFTALTADGRVVTWGQPTGGGNSSAVQDRLKGMVSYLATPTSRGLALKANRLSQAKTSV